MIYPLDNWLTLAVTLTFKQPYPKGFGVLTGKPHLGLDVICAVGTPIRACQNGMVTQTFGKEGGNTVCLLGTDGVLFRGLHLSKYGMSGLVKEGDIIGYTGGKPGDPGAGTSTNPHIHLDLSKNGKLDITDIDNFIDPVVYFKNSKPFAPLAPWQSESLAWAQKNLIVSDPAKSPFTLEQTAWLCECLRKTHNLKP